MRKAFIVITLLNLYLLCSAQDLTLGLRVGLNNSIGTGKGYWDWTTGQEVHRLWSPSYIVSGLVHWQYNENAALELAGSYAASRSIMEVDGQEYILEQNSLEFPLALKLYHSEGNPRSYLKAGTSLILLSNNSSFRNTDTGLEFFTEQRPRNPVHGGMILGYGLEFRGPKDLRYLLEFLYSTYYSSPGYLRMDGSEANIRMHRFELGVGFLY